MNTHFDFGRVMGCLVLVGTMAGCVGSPEDTDPAVGEAREAALNANALNANALNANALNANGLNSGALTPAMLGAQALVWGAMSSATQQALTDPTGVGVLARQLLKYSVGCAYNATQSVTVEWNDDSGYHEDTYVGELGLATQWSKGALDSTGQGWVSACLASRVNYFGVSVMLSSRAPVLTSSATELATYTAQEGAFWGNLFTANPAVYACDYVPDDSHSRAAYRVCAAGYDDGSGTLQGCGMIQRKGSCADTCGHLHEGQYYQSCSSDGGQTSSSQVITVFLP